MTMKKIFIFFFLLSTISAFGQSSVLIEPNANNGIFSKNATTVSFSPGSVSLPASGAGTRLMWIPSKSAFRVGTVEGTQWNADSIGTWSFATGYDAIASGRGTTSMGNSSIARGAYSTCIGFYSSALGAYSVSIGALSNARGLNSTAMGSSTDADGDYSTAMGDNTFATGNYSTAMGSNTFATGNYSTAMGYGSTALIDYSTAMGDRTLASERYSTAMGGETTANGRYSTAMGNNTTAQAFNSTSLGRYNIFSGSTTTWINTEPLFVVGNGATFSNPNNALTLLKNSNLGLNTATPQYQLTFKDDLGDKISLYSGNTTNTTNHYGMGIQSSRFQIFTPSISDDIVFGIGRSGAFTENVRFKGNGNIGLGTSTPNAPLQFASTIANRKIVLYENANNDHQYVGFGVNGNALRYQIDVPNGSHIFYAATNASTSTELMRINSTGISVGGNAAITGEVNRTQTSDANLTPIAYGTVQVSGVLNVNASTSNVSVSKTANGTYEITITGETFGITTHTPVASLASGTLFGFITSNSGSGKLIVYTANTSGTLTDSPFTFVVYKK
jgi:Head domain of trimeric autotransporter adhesin